MGIKKEPLNMNETEIKQMNTIDKLQEKIRLLEFDKIRSNQEMKLIEKKLNLRNIAIRNAIWKLEQINKEENIEEIRLLITSLKFSIKEVEDE